MPQKKKGEIKMKKVHIHSAYSGVIEVDAVEISESEWNQMKYKKKTPSTVFVTETGKGYYNSFTCESDTCNHFSHPRKRWVEFDPQTGKYTDDIKLW